tara:strand:- start:376 stop:564 length:189 start_codon:yes stop_codon:yes gene_type:complete
MHKLTREVEYLTKRLKSLEEENAELKDQLGAAQYAVQDIISHVEGKDVHTKILNRYASEEKN